MAQQNRGGNTRAEVILDADECALAVDMGEINNVELYCKSVGTDDGSKGIGNLVISAADERTLVSAQQLGMLESRLHKAMNIDVASDSGASDSGSASMLAQNNNGPTDSQGNDVNGNENSDVNDNSSDEEPRGVNYEDEHLRADSDAFEDSEDSDGGGGDHNTDVGSAFIVDDIGGDPDDGEPGS